MFLLASFAGWILAFGYGVTKPRLARGSELLATLIGESLGMITMAAIVAMIVSALVASFFLIFQVPFLKSLRRSYAVLVLGVTGLAIYGLQVVKPKAAQPSVDEILAAVPRLAPLPTEEVLEIPDLPRPPSKPSRALTESEREEPSKGSFYGLPMPGRPAPQRQPETGDRVELLVERFGQEFMRDAAQYQAEYAAELEHAGMWSLMKPENVASDTSFRRSRGLLGNVRKVVERFHARSDELISSVPNRIEKLRLEPALQAEVQKTLARLTERIQAVMEESKALDWRIMNHVEEWINHLEATREYWRVENGKFIFRREADLQRFSEIIANVKEDADRQAQLKEQLTN